MTRYPDPVAMLLYIKCWCIVNILECFFKLPSTITNCNEATKKGSLWFKGIELKLADLKKKKANQNAQR